MGQNSTTPATVFEVVQQPLLLPDWLIKALGRWNSNAYQLYIWSSPRMLELVSAQLARVNIPNGKKQQLNVNIKRTNSVCQLLPLSTCIAHCMICSLYVTVPMLNMLIACVLLDV